MAIEQLFVAGYRSIRQMRLRLNPLTVVVGANGVGKSNLYRAVGLLQAAAQGRLPQALAQEGGLDSVLYAGPKRRGPVRLVVGVATDRFHYELTCGLPPPARTAFGFDPEIKAERLTLAERVARRSVVLLERKANTIWMRNADDRRIDLHAALPSWEPALSGLRDPRLFPELTELRDTLGAWRFYHHFPTAPGAPSRTPQVPVRTLRLAEDGSDLASALETIRESGRIPARELDAAIDRALPGWKVRIGSEHGLLAIEFEVPVMMRRLSVREISDGTLRYLCLLAAISSPQPPPLLVLNEPETSLHRDLLEPLAESIVAAAERGQVLVVTHSQVLAAALVRRSGQAPRVLDLVDSETRVMGGSAEGLLDLMPDEDDDALEGDAPIESGEEGEGLA